MRKAIAVILTIVLSLCIFAGCGPKKLLAEEDFNIYRDGQLELDASDIKGSIRFDSSMETFRGLKKGDSITKVKDLYGEESIVVLGEDNTIKEITVNEYTDIVNSHELTLTFYRMYYDNKVYTRKESYSLPAGAQYSCKLIEIIVKDYSVDDIYIGYGNYTMTEEEKNKYNVE